MIIFLQRWFKYFMYTYNKYSFIAFSCHIVCLDFNLKFNLKIVYIENWIFFATSVDCIHKLKLLMNKNKIHVFRNSWTNGEEKCVFFTCLFLWKLEIHNPSIGNWTMICLCQLFCNQKQETPPPKFLKGFRKTLFKC